MRFYCSGVRRFLHPGFAVLLEMRLLVFSPRDHTPARRLDRRPWRWSMPKVLIIGNQSFKSAFAHVAFKGLKPGEQFIVQDKTSWARTPRCVRWVRCSTAGVAGSLPPGAREIARVGSRRVAHAKQPRQRLTSLARQAPRPNLLLSPAYLGRQCRPSPRQLSSVEEFLFTLNSRALLPALLCLLPAASPASRPMLPSSTAAPTCACRAAPAPNPGELSGLGVLSTRRLEAPSQACIECPARTCTRLPRSCSRRLFPAPTPSPG